MQDQTEDQPILKHIQRLMVEEQQLHEQGGWQKPTVSG
jgi:hypothetical protein